MDEDLGQLGLLGHRENLFPRHLPGHLGMLLPNMLFDVGDDLVVIFASHGVTALAVDHCCHVSPFVVKGHRRVGP
jgi:hypothetical protein